MVSNQVFYVVSLTLIALLIISGTASIYFYQQTLQLSKQNRDYQTQIQDEIEKYNSLVSKYNSLTNNFSTIISQVNDERNSVRQIAELYNRSLIYIEMLNTNFGSISAQYNHTITLLTDLVSNLNTSLPVYKTATSELSSLWQNYLGFLKNYTYTSDKLLSLLNQLGLKLRSMNLTVNQEKPAVIKPLVYATNILVDFGNGTKVWYNNTSVQPGWNLYIATLLITKGNLQATWYPQYNAHFVTGLYGVVNSGNNAWFIWTWNSTSHWQIAQYGADQLPVFNGSIYAWTYCSYNPTTYEPNCKP
jgi:archaellum component FlaC